MMESGVYDAVVLGDSSAGLWAAKQLLAKGRKILVIATATSNEQNILPREIASDFEFQSGLVDREKNPLQILTKNYRFRLFTNEEQFKNEFQLQFGRPFTLSPQPDLSFLRGLAYWVRGSETGPLIADEWPGLYAKFFDTLYFDEAPGFVTQTLLAKLEQAGATVVRPGNLRRIFVDRKTVVGVQLANTSQMISVQRAIINTHIEYLNPFLSEPILNASRPLGWNFEIHFECSPEILPAGLTNRMIYVEPDAPILEIFQQRPGYFRLSTAMPMRDFSLHRGEQRRLAARMLKVCESLIPDLEYNIKKIIPDLRDPERTENVELPALYPFLELKKIPSQILTFGSGTPTAPMNPMPGLWVTHEEVSPREGAWGSLEVAKSVIKAFEASFVQKPANTSI